MAEPPAASKLVLPPPDFSLWRREWDSVSRISPSAALFPCLSPNLACNCSPQKDPAQKKWKSSVSLARVWIEALMLVSGTLALAWLRQQGNGKASHISRVGLRWAQSPQLNYLARISKAEGRTFFTREGLLLWCAGWEILQSTRWGKYSKAHRRNTPKEILQSTQREEASNHNIMQGESCTKHVNLSAALPHLKISHNQHNLSNTWFLGQID